MKREIAIVAWIFFSLWAGAYSFHLFPWGEEMEWHHIPHLLTVIGIFALGMLLLDRTGKTED